MKKCADMRNKYKEIILYCSQTGQRGLIDIRNAASITGRSIRTAQRWARTGDIEPPSRRLLELQVFGWLPFPEWRGWRIQGDTLFEQDAHQSYWWDRDRLRTWWIQIQQMNYYRQEYERATGKAAPKLVPVMKETPINLTPKRTA